jgi:hypothetical protein
MRSRNVFFSPPAVAGFALLAIVLGAIFGLRSGPSGTDPDDETQVAGNVIEREPTEAAADETDDPEPIVVPIPAPQDEETEAQAPVEPAPAPQEEAPAPAPAPTVGIVRDSPAPVIPDDDDEPRDRPRPDRSEAAETSRPRPRETPRETESPAPTSPTPTPTPQDVALQTGEGHSRDTALAEDGGWLFREVSGHGAQGGDTSRSTQAHVTVAFNDEVKQAEGPVRSFQCRAWVTAGEGRLTTDSDHIFEVALVALDENGSVTETITSVLERHDYDLAPGETTEDAPMATTPVELNAEDGIDYTCAVTYRDR